MNHLQYFKGKICTIFTNQTNRNFKEENPESFPEQPHLYFVGLIEEIDNEGIFVTQPLTGLKSYFFKHSLIGLAEEELLDPQNERDAEIIDEIKAANAGIKPKKPETINPDELMSLVKNMQESHK